MKLPFSVIFWLLVTCCGCTDTLLAQSTHFPADRWTELPGKTIDDKELQRLLQSLGKKDPALSTASKYIYPEKGLQLEFYVAASVQTLDRVEFYNAGFPVGNTWYSRFPDKLPANLSFDDTRAVAVSKLGKPSRVGDDKLEFTLPAVTLSIFFSRGMQKVVISTKNCISGNCTDGYGVFASRSGERYEGYWKDGVRYGKGSCHFYNGDRYEGYWRNNQPDGEGTMTYKNGTMQKGIWENGHYKGENFLKPNPLYDLVGKHKNSEQVKFLTTTYGNGFSVTPMASDHEKYVFKNGKLVLYFDEQGYVIKVGVFKTGMQDFSGLLSQSLSSSSDQKHVLYLFGEPVRKDNTPTGSVWQYREGAYILYIYFSARRMFQNIEVKAADPAVLAVRKMQGKCLKGNCQNGYGEMDADVGRYKGYFKNGMFQGEGTVVYHSGGTYKGHFKDNLRDGQGTYTWSDKTVYQGTWVKNQQTGKGTMIYPNKDRYEGQWNENRRNGTGTMVYTNGDRYTGTWENDRRNGKGTLYMSNGTFIRGVWTGDALTKAEL